MNAHFNPEMVAIILASAVATRLAASRCVPIRSANRRNMPMMPGTWSLAGFGSSAHSVPKKLPSARKIGTEM